jgi:hypothetical protein
MEGQTVLFNLAAELGITPVAVPNPGDKIGARGLFGADSEAVRSACVGVLDEHRLAPVSADPYFNLMLLTPVVLAQD